MSINSLFGAAQEGSEETQVLDAEPSGGFARSVAEKLEEEQKPAAVAYPQDEEHEDEESPTLMGLVSKFWYVPAGLAVLFFAVLVLPALFGGSSEPQPSAQAPQQQVDQGQQQAEAPAGAGSGTGSGAGAGEGATPVATDTNVVFSEPIKKDGSYYLKAGDVAWKGKLDNTDTGPVLTLEGPTAAQFKQAVSFRDGTITTGVFGRAEPEKPIIHATFQRTNLGEEETTSGTFKVIDDGRVIQDGAYSDERQGDVVTRTYRQWNPQNPADVTTYAKRFTAPAKVPIPALIGWQEPAGAAGAAVDGTGVEN